MSKSKSQQIEYEGILYNKYGLYDTAKLLLLRIFATALSILILWVSVENSKVFFNTLAMFSISQLLYALSLKANDTIRKVFSLFAIIIVMFMGFIAIVGLMGNATIIQTDTGTIIALIRATNTIPLFSGELFVSIIGVVLIVLYSVEWGTSWYAKLNSKPKVTEVVSKQTKGCD